MAFSTNRKSIESRRAADPVAARAVAVGLLARRDFASGELRAIDPKFAAEQFILMMVEGPRRRALGLGAPLTIGSTESLTIDDSGDLTGRAWQRHPGGGRR